MTISFIAKEGAGHLRFRDGDCAPVAFSVIYHAEKIIGGGVVRGPLAALRRAAAEGDVWLHCSRDFCLAAAVSQFEFDDSALFPNSLTLAVFAPSVAASEAVHSTDL
jgi:hypothetical protein